MYTFIASVILVTIISLCVFKNRFWENRYLILLIIAATSLVSMTTIGFVKRGGLPTKVSISQIKYLKDLYVDSVNLDVVNQIPKNNEFLKSENDTIIQINSHVVIFKYNNRERVGWNANDNKKVDRKFVNDIYFDVCDENPRYERRALNYDTSKTGWINKFTLPEINYYYVILLPQHEYDALTDEYKRKLPF